MKLVSMVQSQEMELGGKSLGMFEGRLVDGVHERRGDHCLVENGSSLWYIKGCK